MDTFFFLLSAFCFSFGLLNLVLLLLLKERTGDKGAWSLVLPLIPLTFITFLEIFAYYLQYRYPGRQFPLIVLFYEWGRIGIALSWIFIAYYHYALNRVDILRHGKIGAAGGISLVLAAAAGLAVFRFTDLMPFIHIAVVSMLYFAGIKGILILRKKRSLLPSSMTALTIATISLTVYPAIAVGEILGWRIPFLDPGMSFWVQAHPIYFILVNLPIARFNYLLLRNFTSPKHKEAKELNIMEAGLTAREKEVLELLYLGYRYTEIAERLFLSLATVKTHVHHIYQKLGITRREELFIRSAVMESTEENGL